MTTERTVKLLKQTKFGTDYLYPDNEAALTFSKLLGRKTIKYDDCPFIAMLGFTIRISGGVEEVIKSDLQGL